MIDKKYKDMILEKVNIVDVVSTYVDKLTKSGTRYKCCCPFHKEDTPSFFVDPNTNRWHCFGSCSTGGNSIDFVMKAENLPFVLAVKKICKDYLHINVEDSQMSPEEEEKYKRKEEMWVINHHIAQFFIKQLYESTPEAKAALSYVRHRWGQKNDEYIQEMGIGFAPSDSKKLIEFADKTGLNRELMLSLGILKVGNNDSSVYSFYRNRVMIPVRDKYQHIQAFTARAMDNESTAKYLNSSTSDIYSKESSIFGIDAALRMARQKEVMYLVEGGPDVMKLQSVGLYNTIASLGGAWTDKQFKLLKESRLMDIKLCFIPDSDVPKRGEQLGAGFKNVLSNGVLAMKNGFTVNVKEIPSEEKKKIDPDEFTQRAADIENLESKEFILWYAEKLYSPDAITEERLKVTGDICELLTYIEDETTQAAYMNMLTQKYGKRHEWTSKLREMKKMKALEERERKNKGDDSLTREFGFVVQNNSYYSYDKEGEKVTWSNFKLKPLFHIKDDLRPVRLFEIKNSEPEDPAELVELDMEVLTSSKSFRKKLLGMGNYIWMGNDDNLIRLQSYLAKVTESAVEVKQLGWQKQGFYCFANGAIADDGKWYPTDNMGIIRLDCGKFYIPAMSDLYKDSRELFVFERKFIHKNYTGDLISLHDYFAKTVNVFGNNAMVGLCFFIATLFRDIIKSRNVKLPILNFFGQPGSGKTELAQLLVAFFMRDAEPLDVGGTIASIAASVANVSNALVHLDEYKNSLPENKIGFLKQIWGAVGRTRINIDKDKKVEQSKVDSCVILTGQEMPTADFALFTRILYLTVEKQTFSAEEKAKYEDLMHYKFLGTTHITVEILKHRLTFEANYGESLKKAELDVKSALREYELNSRIRDNWLVPLSAYLAIRDSIDMPFTYEQLFDFVVECIKRQNDMCNSTNEVSGFWAAIRDAIQFHELRNKQDYMLQWKAGLDTNKDAYDFGGKARHILMLRKGTIQMYTKFAKNALPAESILHYLKNTAEFFGQAKNPVRFTSMSKDGIPNKVPVDRGGETIMTTEYIQDRPLYFDYEMLSRKYDVDFESSLDDIKPET